MSGVGNTFLDNPETAAWPRALPRRTARMSGSVATAFRLILQRDATAAELSGIGGLLGSGAWSEAGMCGALAASAEAQAVVHPVIRIYQAAFGRLPDQAGLDFYADWLTGRLGPAVTLVNVADAFVASPEFAARFGAGPVDAAFVTALYANVLGRAPDAAGLRFYLDKAAAGAVTKSSLLCFFSQSPEFAAASAPGIAAFLEGAGLGRGLYDGALPIAAAVPGNLAPVAQDDALSAPFGGRIGIPVATLLANDADADGGALAIMAVGQAVGGRVGLAGGGVTFLPDAGQAGAMGFDYLVGDGRGGFARAHATLTMAAPTEAGLVAWAAARSAVNGGVATLASPTDVGVAALVSGHEWAPATLTYSFLAAPPADWAQLAAGTQAQLLAGFTPFGAAAQANARAAFADAARIANLAFVEVAEGGDIRLSGFASSFSQAFYPTGTAIAGDVFIDARLLATADQGFGSQSAHIITHEIGHALGLRHPFDAAVPLGAALDLRQRTVMSYATAQLFTLTGLDTAQGVTLAETFPSSFMKYDAEALQVMYGPNLSTNRGDTAYVIDGQSGDALSIWDAGGTDLLDASGATRPCVVDMAPGAFSTIGAYPLAQQLADAAARGITYSGDGAMLNTRTGNLAIVQGVVIEQVTTGSAADTVWDNAWDNVIRTGAGDDVIHLGAGGQDQVFGGAGTDTVQVAGARADVHATALADGRLLLVGDGFGAFLSGVERVAFADGGLLLA